MRSIPRLAARIAAVAASVLIGVYGSGAQAQPTGKQAAPAPNKAPTAAQKRMAPPPIPAGTEWSRLAALTEKLNQNTVAVISGNPNGTYMYLAYDMSAVLDDVAELRVLPVIGKGGYQNVVDLLHPRRQYLALRQIHRTSRRQRPGRLGRGDDRRRAAVPEGEPGLEATGLRRPGRLRGGATAD